MEEDDSKTKTADSAPTGQRHKGLHNLLRMLSIVVARNLFLVLILISQLRYGIMAHVINRRTRTDQSTYRRHGGVSVIHTLVSSHFLHHHASESCPRRRRGSCYQPWASGLQTRGSSPRQNSYCPCLAHCKDNRDAYVIDEHRVFTPLVWVTGICRARM